MEIKYKNKQYDIYGHLAQEFRGDFIEDYISSYFAKGQFYEEPLLKYLEETYKPKVIIDAGANIGNHSKFFTEVMGAEVWSFEPEPSNFRILKKNHKDNNFNVGLSDEKGKAGIEQNPTNMGASEITEGDSVKLETLDSYNLEPDLIKIDVEGMESKVIKGAIETIKKFHPVLVVEHNDIQNIFETARLLNPLGYKMRVFDVKTWEMFIYD